MSEKLYFSVDENIVLEVDATEFRDFLDTDTFTFVCFGKAAAIINRRTGEKVRKVIDSFAEQGDQS